MMDIRVGIVTDEQLLDEMHVLRGRIKSEVGRFLMSLPEDASIDDLNIGSVLLELGCEIYDICNVPRDDFIKMVGGQFDITRKRLAQLQAEMADKQ